MSEENLQVVRAMFDAFSRGDTPAMLKLADASVVFTPIPDTPDVQDFHGHEGFMQGIAQTTEIWDDFSAELREMRDFDDHVLLRCGGGGVDRVAGYRWKSTSASSSPSVKARSSAGNFSRLSSRPSKPPGCGSRQDRTA